MIQFGGRSNFKPESGELYPDEIVQCSEQIRHIQGVPTGAACPLKMRPTTAPSATTS
jgi:hypothetical protein